MSGESSAEVTLTRADLERALSARILTPGQVEALLALVGVSASGPERARGLNWVSVAYYAGALLMISAFGWFLGDHWKELGSGGILATTLICAAMVIGLGVWLRRQQFETAANLLFTVAVCLTPLATYCVEDLLGWWPSVPPGRYADYFPWIRASWIGMELATVAAALLAMRWVRLGFITAPLAFSLWFFSMDFAAYLGGEYWDKFEGRRQVSEAVGLITLALGFALERLLQRGAERRDQDYAFWCYLFGMLAFWGALTASPSSTEFGKALYAGLNVGFIALGVWRRRALFVPFGAVGVNVYVAHLAQEVFKDSVYFPFALILLGLWLILSTVALQRLWRRTAAA